MLSRSHLVRAALAGGLLLSATTARAASLECVSRAINWNAASQYNYVAFTLVTLHEQGIASFATGSVNNSTCSLAPFGIGSVGCLKATNASNALLSNSPAPAFNPQYPLTLKLDSIPSDDVLEAHLHQPNATYAFAPSCAGNQLIGDDQWGNHWTVSFQLGTALPPR
jgi:hypothetical protein